LKLLYVGGTAAELTDFKRLLLLANEVAFMDRPSVTFGDWGTIGIESPMRRVNSEGSPVAISVFAPPSGPANFGYQNYIEADLGNPHFQRAFVAGLRSDERFARKFIQLEANYGDSTGRQVLESLLADKTLTENFEAVEVSRPGAMYRVDTAEGRRVTLAVLLTEASVMVTSAQLVAAHAGATPITEVSGLARLLSIRLGDPAYGGSPTTPAWLAAAIINSVIPAEVLDRLSVDDILTYRRKTKDAYDSFLTEVDRLSVNLADMDAAEAESQVPKLIASDVIPHITEYRNEFVGVRDALFASLLKDVVKWELPTVSIAFLAGSSFGVALATFLGGVRAVAPSVIDYVRDRRALRRNNAFVYLLDLVPKTRVLVKP
jgi:hypothetical protein